MDCEGFQWNKLY